MLASLNTLPAETKPAPDTDAPNVGSDATDIGSGLSASTGAEGDVPKSGAKASFDDILALQVATEPNETAIIPGAAHLAPAGDDKSSPATSSTTDPPTAGRARAEPPGRLSKGSPSPELVLPSEVIAKTGAAKATPAGVDKMLDTEQRRAFVTPAPPAAVSTYTANGAVPVTKPSPEHFAEAAQRSDQNIARELRAKGEQKTPSAPPLGVTDSEQQSAASIRSERAVNLMASQVRSQSDQKPQLAPSPTEIRPGPAAVQSEEAEGLSRNPLTNGTPSIKRSPQATPAPIVANAGAPSPTPALFSTAIDPASAMFAEDGVLPPPTGAVQSANAVSGSAIDRGAAAPLPVRDAPTPAMQIAAAAIRSGGDRIEVRLDPPELGRVLMNFQIRDDQIIAQIHADRSETSDLLRRNGDDLQKTLRENGFGDVQLDFGEHQSPDGDEAPAHALETDDISTSTPMPLRSHSGAGLDIRV